MNVVLGSSSPRRKALMSGLFDSFEIIPPSIDESIRHSEKPVEFTKRISREKCSSILESIRPVQLRGLVITADTIVSIEDAIIGKPADYGDALRILSLLNGKTHNVITSLTLAVTGDDSKRNGPITGSELTEVHFKKLRIEDLERYLGAIDYRDKAGSYAFQEYGDMIIESFRGSATNIIGFPLRLFFAMVGELGLTGRLFL